ncbi:MAG: DUF126 domain-containing protein [Canidatus Methanoxibalbensis ujae]|nr:DUF126 domain-containing protein [Candidatus Methanoxibalbensis ujae]RLG39202.1 MAG: hypothetical protein DRN79_00335 [Methanosarcinales archaeon]
MPEARRFYGRSVVKGVAKGEVLFSSHRISFLGGVDPKSGTVVDPSLDIFGKCVAGKILVFDGGKGSTVGSYVIYQLKLHGKHPRAMIVRKADTIVAVGAIIAEIPMIEMDLNLNGGETVLVNATEGFVEIC